MAHALRDLRILALRRAAIVTIAFAVTVALGVGLIVAASKQNIPLELLPFAIAVPVWLATTKRTGLALAVVLLYLGLIDGFVKLRSGGQVATLGRDVVLYAVAIGMAARTRGAVRVPALTGWVVAWIVIVAVELANPGNSSISHAVASMRQDLEFVPLFFIGFAVLRTRRSLHGFLALLLAVAAINGVVAAYQGSLSKQRLAAWGPGYARLVSGPDARLFNTASGAQRIRPPGLGSDEGFGGDLGATAIPGGIVLLMAYRRRRWLLALIVLGLLGATVGVLTSESRSSLVMALVGVLALLGLISVAHQARRGVIALILIAALAAAAVEVIGSFNSQAFSRYRSIAPGSAASTIASSRTSTWALTPKYMGEIPFGAGLGKVGPAANKAGGVNTTWNAESEFNFLIVEVGVPGMLLLIAFQVALGRVVITGLRREPDAQTAVTLAGLAAPLLGYAVTWLVGVYTTEPPSAPYLWLAAGVLSWWLVSRHRELGLGPGPGPDARRLAAARPGGRGLISPPRVRSV